MLEISEIILTNDSLARERAKQFAEYHEHRRRTSPTGNHAVRYLKKVENRGKTVKTAFVFSITLAKQKAAAQRTL